MIVEIAVSHYLEGSQRCEWCKKWALSETSYVPPHILSSNLFIPPLIQQLTDCRCKQPTSIPSFCQKAVWCGTPVGPTNQTPWDDPWTTAVKVYDSDNSEGYYTRLPRGFLMILIIHINHHLIMHCYISFPFFPISYFSFSCFCFLLLLPKISYLNVRSCLGLLGKRWWYKKGGENCFKESSSREWGLGVGGRGWNWWHLRRDLSKKISMWIFSGRRLKEDGTRSTKIPWKFVWPIWGAASAPCGWNRKNVEESKGNK